MDKKMFLPLILLLIMIPIFTRVLGPLFDLVLPPSQSLLPIPGNAVAHLTIILAAMPIVPVFLLLFEIPLALIMVYVHRLVKLGSQGYRVEPIGEKFSLYDLLKRGVIPGFFSWSIGIQFTILTLSQIEVQGPQQEFIIRILHLSTMPTSFVYSLFVIPLASILWSPIWLLEDAGIVTFIKLKEGLSRSTPNTEGVGRYYKSYLNGFVGISTLITIATFFWVNFRYTALYGPADQQIRLMSMVTSFMIPIYVIFAFTPLLLLHEYAYKKLGNFLIRILKNRNVIEPKIDSEIAPQ